MIRAGTYENKKGAKGLSVQFLDLEEAEKFAAGNPDLVDAVQSIVSTALSTGKGQYGEKPKKEKKEKEATPSKKPAAKKSTAKASTNRAAAKAERAKARREAAAAKATV